MLVYADGRPPTCDCGECAKCRKRVAQRKWYQRQDQKKRRSIVEARDPEKVRASDSARYYRDRAKRLAQSQRWAEENRERRNEISRAWAQRNKEKVSAQRKARRAMLKGLISRMPCEVCGEERAHMHHDDYSRPLEVRWLCAAHHGEVHRRF